MRLFICLLMLGGASALGQVMTFQSDGNATVREVGVDDPSSTPIDPLANDGAPTEFPNGIAIASATNGTPVWGHGITTNGMPFYWIDHASPRNPAVAMSNKLAALERATAFKANASTNIRAIKTRASAANSVPALREEVSRLAELIEAMANK